MARSTIAYLRFLINSTNEHGVHSPFVYRYVTQCLYQKPKHSRNKVTDILLKSIGFFGYQTILTDDVPVQESIKKVFPNAKFQMPNAKPDASNTSKESIDLALFNEPNHKRIQELLNLNLLHNDSMILINTPKKNKAQQLAWSKIKALPQISVSMDLFYGAILFIRQEQPKEHFIIRT